jgi:UDP-2,3-diacylglucosamine pyrophosphatase LpxH
VTFLVAGDWHLAPESPAAHGRLARAFLARAGAAGATVVLNGDVFDELFAGPDRAREAHPAVVEEIRALSRAGRLLRVRGNHDPGAGEERVVLEVEGTGRVLVAHGHTADPLSASPLGRAGDAVARRFGRAASVRAAARLAEGAARALAGGWMAAAFRRRCLALVDRERFDLGVFGHVHVSHLVPGDRYANAGALLGETLAYLALDRAGIRLAHLRLADLEGRGDGIGPEMG